MYLLLFAGLLPRGKPTYGMSADEVSAYPFSVVLTSFFSIIGTYTFPNGSIVHDGADFYVLQYLQEALNLDIT